MKLMIVGEYSVDLNSILATRFHNGQLTIFLPNSELVLIGEDAEMAWKAIKEAGFSPQDIIDQIIEIEIENALH